jgi:hypothetical protein
MKAEYRSESPVSLAACAKAALSRRLVRHCPAASLDSSAATPAVKAEALGRKRDQTRIKAGGSASQPVTAIFPRRRIHSHSNPCPSVFIRGKKTVLSHPELPARFQTDWGHFKAIQTKKRIMKSPSSNFRSSCKSRRPCSLQGMGQKIRLNRTCSHLIRLNRTILKHFLFLGFPSGSPRVPAPFNFTEMV